MTERISLVLAVALLLGTTASSGEVQDETNSTTLDGDPITSEEVLAPAVDWLDEAWAGLPFEDPASVDCGGRQVCEEALENATAAEGP